MVIELCCPNRIPSQIFPDPFICRLSRIIEDALTAHLNKYVFDQEKFLMIVTSSFPIMAVHPLMVIDQFCIYVPGLRT